MTDTGPSGTGRAGSRRSRVLWPVLAGLAIVAAAIAVIIWLPLDAEVEADVQEALVGYETSREVAWPASEPLVLPLSEAAKATLVARVERDLRRNAAGEALDDFDAAGAVSDFEAAATSARPWVVTKWRGEVVSFDFVRQTLRGEVVVRAGVRRDHQTGRMNDEKGRVVARRWVWADGAVVVTYTLRDDGEHWRVVQAVPWGTCGPEGEDVVEGVPGA